MIVTGRDPEKLAAAKGVAAVAEQLDSTSEDHVTAFFDRIGAFDHLVLAFSPGAVGIGPLTGIKLADIRAAFDGKLFPYLFAIQHAQVTGSITLISASTARSGLAGTVTFAAVNGAIERIVSPLAAELAPVRVNAVSPGAVDTPWWSFLPDEDKQAQFAAAVVAGDLAQVVVAFGPLQQHGPDPVEVAPDGVHVPGLGPWTAVAQEPGPVLDVTSDAGREAAELVLQPLVERRRPIVEEGADAIEHFSGAFDAEPP
ncbi:SDR family oxidoreductase [Streptomyces sp. NPDC059467]|uniref:SDR family oxidoreductase n=1 Tax=Streptomyces sp. NPDC059467 TaxID=3346844 RepID=UPI0036D00007